MIGSQQTLFGLAVGKCLGWMLIQTASLFVTSIGNPILLHTRSPVASKCSLLPFHTGKTIIGILFSRRRIVYAIFRWGGIVRNSHKHIELAWHCWIGFWGSCTDRCSCLSSATQKHCNHVPRSTSIHVLADSLWFIFRKHTRTHIHSPLKLDHRLSLCHFAPPLMFSSHLKQYSNKLFKLF